MLTGALVGRVAGDVAIAQEDPAAGRQLEAADHAQGRRLAAAGRAEQREELARGDVEGHPSTATTSPNRLATRSSWISRAGAGTVAIGRDGTRAVRPASPSVPVRATPR